MVVNTATTQEIIDGSLIMKQYLNSDQTAKLIELGFERPKSIVSVSLTQGDMVDMQGRYDTELEYERAYSIGELVEMLPTAIRSEYIDYAIIEIFHDVIWVVGYNDTDGKMKLTTSGRELIDALYDMAIKLKEEGVI